MTILCRLSLLPVYTFAPAYLRWHTTPINSVSTFVMVFKSALPDLCQQVRHAGTLRGMECREAYTLQLPRPKDDYSAKGMKG